MEKMRGEGMAAGGHEALLRETMARLARSKVLGNQGLVFAWGPRGDALWGYVQIRKRRGFS
jgi:hypothetical protein